MSKTKVNDKYIGKLLEERYQILELIGQGGQAVVYRALDTRLSRNVAVKIMREEFAENEEFRERFNAESHAVAMLSHPNIVAVYDVSHKDDLEFIVMEMINGITLRQYMDRRERVDWREALHFSKQIADALRHAHQHGVIHRDIKPQNIMLLKDGTIKVADFGIAALENEAAKGSSSEGIGSLNYLAPEQLRGNPAGAKSDIYSLGIMMYELICGNKPYQGDKPADILVKLENSEIPKVKDVVEDVPEELSEIIAKAMDPGAVTRYQSADELIEDFNGFTTDFLNTDGKYKAIEEQNAVEEAEKVEENKAARAVIRRVNRASFGLSAFGVLLLAILTFALLWKIWLGDIFEIGARVKLPDFTGYAYEDLSNNVELTKVYNFKANYVVNTETAGGTVLSQEPAPGRSLMMNKKGIVVTLNVSTGYILTDVPDVTGLNYKEAVLKLTNAGFVAEINNIASDSVEKDLVMSMSPLAGEKITAGSTVYIDVSGGKEINYISMPNLVGLSEDAAINKITRYNLTYAGSTRVESEYEAGTVISQSTPAFAEIEERTNITITVSSGPPVVTPEPEIIIG